MRVPPVLVVGLDGDLEDGRPDGRAGQGGGRPTPQPIAAAAATPSAAAAAATARLRGEQGSRRRGERDERPPDRFGQGGHSHLFQVARPGAGADGEGAGRVRLVEAVVEGEGDQADGQRGRQGGRDEVRARAVRLPVGVDPAIPEEVGPVAGLLGVCVCA